MAKDISTSLMDRRLLAAAASGLTGTEMEEKYGVPAAEALVRVRQLLGNTRSAFDDFEQRQLLVLSLQGMLADIKASGVDVTNPKHIEAVTKLTLAIDRVNSNQAKISDEMLNTVSEAQSRRLLTMLETAYGPARDWLKEHYGAFVDIADFERVFLEGLRKAAQDSA